MLNLRIICCPTYYALFVKNENIEEKKNLFYLKNDKDLYHMVKELVIV
jgi:hypothetical protein